MQAELELVQQCRVLERHADRGGGGGNSAADS